MRPLLPDVTISQVVLGRAIASISESLQLIDVTENQGIRCYRLDKTPLPGKDRMGIHWDSLLCAGHLCKKQLHKENGENEFSGIAR